MSNVYTHEERRTIIDYLVDNNIHGNLQGNALWKRMEQEGVLNRSWQSMRSHFKTQIINMLHLYSLSEYHCKMILHGFGRNARPNTKQLAKPVPVKKPIPFSSDSDSDTTVCVAAQAKRPRRESGSNTSLDLLACNTTNDKRNVNANDNHPSTSVSGAKPNHDIRSYLINMADAAAEKPKTSTPKAKGRKIRKQKRIDTIVIIDSDDDEPIKTEVTEQQAVEHTITNEAFSLEEDTQLIMFFKAHQCYLADIRNNFAYVAFNYATPTSMRTPNELRTRFVDHIMPKLYTYDCLTYEEMVTYYDRTDIDVPVEFQQIISKTVAEQRKNKQAATAKAAVDVATQADQRSSADKMIGTDESDIEVEIILDQLAAQDQPNPRDARPDGEAAGKAIIVDAATEVAPANADKMCNTTLVDAAMQVQPATEDKASNTERQRQANASTQTQQQQLCNTDVVAQHVEFVTDNMLHIFLPEQDERRPLQDLQNIYDKYGKSQKGAHMARPKKYLNDNRYVDVAADSSAQPIDKCQTELSRLTAEVKRLEGALRKLRGYEAKEAVGDNKENQNAENSWAVENGQCTNVSDMSDNTTIISCTVASDGEADKSGTRGSQAVNRPELMFDTFQTELDKKDASTQIAAAPSDEQQLDSSNATQDGDHEESSAVIAIQPDIEFSARQLHQPIEVMDTSDDTDNTDRATGNAAGQMEPLNLSTYGSEENENGLSTNSDKFYSALSQN